MLRQRLFWVNSRILLNDVCDRLAASLCSSDFLVQDRQHSSLATKAVARDGLFIQVTEYLNYVNPEDVGSPDYPDYWDIAWRASVGQEYNYQVILQWNDDSFSRHQVRRLRTRLRCAFEAEVFSIGNAKAHAVPDGSNT